MGLVRVLVEVLAAVGQGHLVIQLRGHAESALALALGAQRVQPQVLLAEAREPAPPDSVCGHGSKERGRQDSNPRHRGSTN